jgi:hypothetical protein
MENKGSVTKMTIPDETDLIYFEISKSQNEAEADIRVKIGKETRYYTGYLKLKEKR